MYLCSFNYMVSDFMKLRFIKLETIHQEAIVIDKVNRNHFE